MKLNLNVLIGGGNEVYRTKSGTPILRLPEDGWFSIAGAHYGKIKTTEVRTVNNYSI